MLKCFEDFRGNTNDNLKENWTKKIKFPLKFSSIKFFHTSALKQTKELAIEKLSHLVTQTPQENVIYKMYLQIKLNEKN